MLEKIGKSIRKSFSEMFYICGFVMFLFKETIVYSKKNKSSLKVLVMQIYFTAVEALPIISIIAIGLGAAIIIQGNSILPSFGQGDLLYRILIVVIMRELGPLLTAFIIIARSGSAITTEIGNMVISHEMEAYISIGFNPLSQIGVPRLIGVTAGLFLLNIYFNVMGLLGSYLVATVISPFPFSVYIYNLVNEIYFLDILSSILKSIIFGIIIAVVSIYWGFKVNRAVTEVPQRTIKSIGVSMIGCIIADAVIILITQLG